MGWLLGVEVDLCRQAAGATGTTGTRGKANRVTRRGLAFGDYWDAGEDFHQGA